MRRARSASPARRSTPGRSVRPGELLEAVPGLIVTQHSGEGKANQYFLRGFNLDHGTDLAIWLDGMPVNMRTHGHGQGYADLNFLIPELVEQMTVRRGRTGPRKATSPRPARCGSPTPTGWRRAWSWRPAAASATGAAWRRARCRSARARSPAAAEIGAYNGPWQVPDALRKFNGFLRYSEGTRRQRLLPHRAWPTPTPGTRPTRSPRAPSPTACLGRFGTLDPTDGGDTPALFAVGALAAERRAQRRRRSRPMRSTRRSTSTTTSPISSTIPVNGDQFQQSDKRKVLGLNASHLLRHELAGFAVGDHGRHCRSATTTSASACSTPSSARRSRPCATTR